ncbi:MAG TPA: FtsW/RodA/SpoVE family cell cycle protein [Deinococcales bacterium]|nr:FtsW/RodA/SpoVE family cell cycle protein [Deinococcales bacterium]
MTREIVLPFLATVILGVGLLALSSVAPEPGLLTKQLLGAGASIVVLAALSWLGRRRLYALALPLYALSLALLALTLVVGTEVNGNRNWLGRGFFQFQPLEFAKLALILMLARFMREPIRGIRDYLPVAAIALPVIGLVFREDFGGTLVLLVIVLGMMVVRGLPWKHLLLGVTLAAVAIPTVIFPRLQPYQQKRLTIVFNPASDPRGVGYQVIQAMIAIGSGGLTGKGYKEGSQSQFGFVPEEHTDMILATWAEEQGFIGAAFLLFLFAALFWRLTVMGGECPSETDKLVIGGVMSMLGFQVLENIGAAIGVAPLTGLTLPLVSYGVSSLIAVVAALGVVYVVHRDRYREF